MVCTRCSAGSLTLTGLRQNHTTNNIGHFMKHKAFIISSWNIQGLRSSAINQKYRHCHPTRNMVKRRRTHWLPSRLQRAGSPIHQTTRCEQGRNSGGMLMWYKADLTHSIKLIKSGTFYIWLEIKKEMILTKKNVLRCATYIPH